MACLRGRDEQSSDALEGFALCAFEALGEGFERCGFDADEIG
jgi:hypothetical protein